MHESIIIMYDRIGSVSLDTHVLLNTVSRHAMLTQRTCVTRNGPLVLTVTMALRSLL